jgi:hypothetical protein
MSFAHGIDDVGKVEQPLLLAELGIEHHLEQQITELPFSPCQSSLSMASATS